MRSPAAQQVVYFLVAQIPVQNDQPSIVHDMSVFLSHQLPDWWRERTREHDARWLWMRPIRSGDQVARHAAGVHFLVIEISVQNDQPSIVHEMSVFASHQLPDLRGERTRKHDARRFDGLPTCARAYQIINALAVILPADRHNELLVLRQTKHRAGFGPCQQQSLNRVCDKSRPPSGFAANLA